MTGDDASARPRWLAAVRRYLVAVAVGNLLWEAAQLPLYTLWRTEPVRSLVRAVLHCTAGDIVIAAVMRVIALVAVGNARWPNERLVAVVVVVVATGVAIQSAVNTSTRLRGDGPIPNGCRRCPGWGLGSRRSLNGCLCRRSHWPGRLTPPRSAPPSIGRESCRLLLSCAGGVWACIRSIAGWMLLPTPAAPADIAASPSSSQQAVPDENVPPLTELRSVPRLWSATKGNCLSQPRLGVRLELVVATRRPSVSRRS